MKFKVNSDSLNQKIREASKIAIKNNFNPLFECIYIKTEDHNLILKATNMEIFFETMIPIKTELNGEFYIKASVINRPLESFSKNSEILEIEKKDNCLEIKNQKGDVLIFELYNNEDSGFLNLPKPSKTGIEIDKNAFIESIRSVAFCAAKTEIKPEISGVYIYNKNENIYFVATDTYRLAEKVIYFESNVEFNIILQNKNINTILSILDGEGKIKIDYYEEGIIIIDNNNILSVRTIMGNYPDYKQLFPKEWNRIINIDKDNISGVLQTIVNLTGEDKVASFMIGENSLNIKADQKSVGKLTESLDFENILLNPDLKEFEVYYNPVFVQEGLTKIKDNKIKMSWTEDRRPLFISGDKENTFTYLIMPRFK